MNYVATFLLIISLVVSPIVKAQNNYEPHQVIVSVQSYQHLISVINEFKEQQPLWQLQINHALSTHANIYLLNFDSLATHPPKVIEAVKQHEAIKIAQVNHTNITQRNIVPNDLKYPLQWSLQDSTYNTQIFAPQGWQISSDGVTAAGDTIVMAVIDGGVDVHHIDLNIHINAHEIPFNGVDDDQNGYIDDFYGWNAYNSSGTPVNDPHGTHVAGIMGARTNNNEGIAGIVWGGKILPVIGSSSNEAVVLEAYGYVLAQRLKYNESNGDSGAYVVCTNSSFGVDDGQPADYPIWCAFYDTLGQAGIINMGATTNAFSNVDVWGDIPTTCPSNHIISVTSLAQNGVIQGGYGATHIDLGAPGRNIYSTIPGHSYSYKSGTSMATPHVAGVVGAMISSWCSDDIALYNQYPDSMALEIRKLLLNNVTPLNLLNGRVASGGTLNMYQALLATSKNNCVSTQFELTHDSCNTCDGVISVQATGNFPPYSIAIHSADSIYIADSVATNLCADSFLIAVTDAVNVTSYFWQEVTHPDTLRVSLTVDQPSSNTSTDGNVYSIVNGGISPYQYMWNTNATSSNLTQVAAGIYHLTVTDSAHCLVSDSVNLFSVGIQPVKTQNSTVYPNPAAHNITVTSKGNLINEVAIYTLAGQLISITNNVNAYEFKLPLHLSSGSYIVVVNQIEHHQLVVE